MNNDEKRSTRTARKSADGIDGTDGAVDELVELARCVGSWQLAGSPGKI